MSGLFLPSIERWIMCLLNQKERDTLYLSRRKKSHKGEAEAEQRRLAEPLLSHFFLNSFSLKINDKRKNRKKEM